MLAGGTAVVGAANASVGFTVVEVVDSPFPAAVVGEDAAEDSDITVLAVVCAGSVDDTNPVVEEPEEPASVNVASTLILGVVLMELFNGGSTEDTAWRK
jgi:hypothetical protein